MSTLLNLRNKCDDSEIHLLLSEMGYPLEIRDRKVTAILEEYQIHPEQPLLGLKLHEKLSGLIGLRLLPGDEAEIRHIVVAQENRHSGIGRQLVFRVRSLLKLSKLTAETDSDAVGFYRKLGFQVTSLGESYPTRERFRCVYETGS